MTTYDEERLGELLRLLPPAPAGWVTAAQELPVARVQLDALVERARPMPPSGHRLWPTSSRRSALRVSSRAPSSSSTCASASRGDGAARRRRPPPRLRPRLSRPFSTTEAPAPSAVRRDGRGSPAAMAAALVTMVGRGSGTWLDGAGIAAQAKALRTRLTALGEADAAAFAQVLVTMRDRSGTPEQRDFALGRGARPRRRGTAADR